jgi:ATP-dependent DNA helicase RecG
VPLPDDELKLESPLTVIPGIGPTRAKAFAELGIRNVAQLINYLPVRHEKQEAEAPIKDLVPDAMVSARGIVSATRLAGKMPKQRFEVVLVDDTGRLDLVWFAGAYLRHAIQPGVRLWVQGKAKRFGHGLQLANPKHRVLGADEPAAHDERLRPVYPASEALTSVQIEQAIASVLNKALALIDDHLPDQFRDQRELLSLAQAYRALHMPESPEHAAAGRRRLAYDELLFLQLAMSMKRHQRQTKLRAPALRWSDKVDAAIRKRFPFTLTDSQNEVIAELAKDLQEAEPANRLVQGDVGSGKTVVALYAMLMAVASKHQAALMAPTEILAEQHFASISRMLAGSDVRIELLTGALTTSERQRIAGACAEGTVDIVIGTHALLSDKLAFKSLAIAVIDEQHRFGVHQRLALRGKGDQENTIPHTLVMTATPIPRTLAMTLFGDLDVSTIRHLPPGRKPIQTRVVAHTMRDEVWQFVRTRIERGQQAYVVVPAIDPAHEEADLFVESGLDPVTGQLPTGAPPLANVVDTMRELSDGPLKGLRLASMHGRLTRAQREPIMTQFRAGQLDVLVSTTVIEVGVDVPNACVMVIVDADRFGLAQLHQLRGRVGRGPSASACILIAQGTTDDAIHRLGAMASASDGFALAEKDLEIRGFGQLLGTRQAGMPPFRVVDFSKDLDLLAMARRDAHEWIERSPQLAGADNKLVMRRLTKAHGRWLGLADVA